MKLLKKDLLKWIKNMRSGAYEKGSNELVSHDGMYFCCLGVWADQHGATWLADKDENLIPIPKGGSRPSKIQDNSSLKDRRLQYGLTTGIQSDLMVLNDESFTWNPVIEYIEKEMLPKAV